MTGHAEVPGYVGDGVFFNDRSIERLPSYFLKLVANHRRDVMHQARVLRGTIRSLGSFLRHFGEMLESLERVCSTDGLRLCFPTAEMVSQLVMGDDPQPAAKGIRGLISPEAG